MDQPTLEAKNIQKRFSSAPDDSPGALQGINLKLHGGEVLGILGPNHSGKSLLLSVLARRITPSEGTITGCEHSIGLMPEQSIFPSVFRVKDILSYHSHQACRSAQADQQDPEAWLKGTPLKDCWRTPITDLDTVQTRWLSFYLACYGQPRAVMLDEPFQFFDSAGIAHLHKEVEALKARGVAVAIASHDVERLRQFCDEMVILHHGKIVHRAKKILPESDDGAETYFCLHITGAHQDTFDSWAKAKAVPAWQALFFEGFLARVFYRSYADCYQMLQKVLEDGLVLVKFDTEDKPHLDDHNITPHLASTGGD